MSEKSTPTEATIANAPQEQSSSVAQTYRLGHIFLGLALLVSIGGAVAIVWVSLTSRPPVVAETVSPAIWLWSLFAGVLTLASYYFFPLLVHVMVRSGRGNLEKKTD
jgi:hypothetical protein